MTSNESTPRRSILRTWLPALVLGLTVAISIGIWTWPGENFETAHRVSATSIVLALSTAFFAIWYLFLGPQHWLLRLLMLVAVLWAIPKLMVRDVRFSGDLIPQFSFRWQRSFDDVLDDHRERRPSAPMASVKQLAEIRPGDYPEYRGPNRNGIVPEFKLNRDWKAKSPKQLWSQPCGGGYASFAVVGDAVVTIEQRRDLEAVVCYDSQTGHERWMHSYPASFVETLGGPGPRATPTIAGGDVYSLGATGILVCLDAATGRLKWQRNILEDNDNIFWAMSGSPLVYDRFVVVNPGAQKQPAAAGKALVALDRVTGEVAWTSGDTPAGYSSPMLASLAGRRQILLLDGKILAGYDPNSGKQLWTFDFPTYQGINVAQPLVLGGDRVFISAGYDVGCVMLQITQQEGKWSVNEMWRNKNLRCKFTSPIMYKGHIYGLDEGILACIDQETGKRMWRDGRHGHGQLLLTGDVLFILSEKGKMVLVSATPEKYLELATMSVFTERTWNYPALANGKAYVRTDQDMACFDLE